MYEVDYYRANYNDKKWMYMVKIKISSDRYCHAVIRRIPSAKQWVKQGKKLPEDVASDALDKLWLVKFSPSEPKSADMELYSIPLIP
jgi:hypothetical protein